jgi:hypothetical protein
MRRFAFVALSYAVVTCALLSCGRPPQRTLVGEWTGKDYLGHPAFMVFSPDGTVKLAIDHLELDGPTFGGTVTWRLDASKTPAHLDIVVKAPAKQGTVIPMIVRFISDRQIQIRIDEDLLSRPTNFSDDGSRNQIVFVKRQ